MMYCGYCGKAIQDDSAFCEHCGRRVVVENPETGHTAMSSLKSKASDSAAKAGRWLSSAYSGVRQFLQKPQGRLIGILAAAAVVMLCVVCFVLVPILGRIDPGQGKTKNLINKTKTIYVMDGKAVFNDGSEKLSEMYEYRFSDDGFPLLRYHVDGKNMQMTEPVFYGYDYNGYIEDIIAFHVAKPELSAEEAARQEEILENKLAEFLYAQNLLPIVSTTEWMGIKDDCITVRANDGTFWQYEYNAKGELTKNTLYVFNTVHTIMTYTYTDAGKIASYEQTYYSDYSSLNGMTYRYEYTYGSDNRRKVKYTEMSNGEVQYTTEYEESLVYDSNELLTGVTRKNDDTVLVTTEYRYHFRKLEVPAASVELLCNVYERTGVEYVLGGWGVSVENTLSEEEMAEIMISNMIKEW